jgi:hypothetical protein
MLQDFLFEKLLLLAGHEPVCGTEITQLKSFRFAGGQHLPRRVRRNTPVDLLVSCEGCHDDLHIVVGAGESD